MIDANVKRDLMTKFIADVERRADACLDLMRMIDGFDAKDEAVVYSALAAAGMGALLAQGLREELFERDKLAIAFA